MSTFDTGPAAKMAFMAPEVTEDQRLDSMGAGPVPVMRPIDGTLRDVLW